MHPYLFKGMPYEMPTWDLCLYIGFFIVMALALIKRPRDYPLSRPGLCGLSLLMLYFGLVGTKILYMFLHWESLVRSNLPLIGKFATAGFAYLGALVFEILTIFAFTKFRKNRVSFLKVADYAIPFLMLHQAFTRIGCFLAGCCYGKPTDLPWGVTFPSMYPKFLRHPTQLYSVIFLLFIFFLMRYVYKKGFRPGITLFGTLGMYGFLRFFNEFLRADSLQGVIGIITLAQIALLTLLILSVLAIWIILKGGVKMGKTTILLTVFFFAMNMVSGFTYPALAEERDRMEEPDPSLAEEITPEEVTPPLEMSKEDAIAAIKDILGYNPDLIPLVPGLGSTETEKGEIVYTFNNQPLETLDRKTVNNVLGVVQNQLSLKRIRLMQIQQRNLKQIEDLNRFQRRQRELKRIRDMERTQRTLRK